MILRRKLNRSKIEKIINTIKGLEKPDVVIKNGQLVDVATGQLNKANIYIKEDVVAFLSNESHELHGESTYVIDASGLYVSPGFIDPHTHIESSLSVPSMFGFLLLKEGTTTSIVDPHEVANVAGIEGLKAVISDMEVSPIKFIIQIPTCVPPEPDLEVSGNEIGSKKLAEIGSELMRSNVVVGLGEMMGYRKLLDLDEDLIEKIRWGYENSLIVDGHAADMTGLDLQGYSALKIMTDHCARRGKEITERLRSGLYVQIQRRWGESNFDEIVNVLKGLPSLHRVMWCTDDAEADEIWYGRHTIRSIVKEAIELSLDPVKAIQMATINVAQAYRVDSEIGIIAPGRFADILIFRSLEKLDIDSVLVNGKLVFHRGEYLISLPEPHRELEKFRGSTLLIGEEIEPIDLVPKAEIESGLAVVNVLTVDKTIVQEKLPVDSGIVMADPHRDISWISVINRYGGGHISCGFIKGIGIKEGAFATSISHDTHNVVVIGVDINDMYRSLLEIKKSGGGLVLVKRGQVISKIELPYFGLMSSDPSLPVQISNFKEKLLSQGVKVHLKKLMFLTLTVGRGGYAITDRGLIDYKNKKILPVIREYV